ncbi:glycosyltransferase family 4 protein [Polynucleobacter wuianus]|uniref:glycosyltransferase family 4 protein n=1 Tax=Polynucleobacter wuianus TaxID=1743168 RepID=UPI001C0C82F6|nr:glycosyltransferase [Polynucleobacter wuianus]MBU3609285.1 glycosyltransferase family 4 protein [Polynucleobacter wuianus]
MIIRTQSLHGRISGDANLDGPQKFHTKIVPRIGGLAIVLGVFIPIALFDQGNTNEIDELFLLASILPGFGIGIVEDLAKSVSVKIRLLFISIGALVAIFLLGTSINHLDIPGIDYVIAIPAISMLFTVFAITGLTNAYNIIDGFNGLSSMIGLIALMVIGYVGILFSDSLIVLFSFTLFGAILGFFILNYPRGLIFLGDGGAYLIGFWVALLSILIVNRHTQISPWFAVMVNAYPILETLFTIYRRKYRQGKSPGHPDGLHFHSLIFRRILNSSHINSELEWFSANAKTSPYLWLFSSFAVIPAIFFWHSTPILIGF